MKKLMLVLALALALLATPTLADHVVMKDGSRVETKGPFQVKGRQVVFTNLKGQLHAVPLAEVDLEASKAPRPSPAPAAAAQNEPAAAKKPDILTLTDADVSHVDPTASTYEGLPPTVDMYTTSWCPACKRARTIFQALGVDYTNYDIEKSEEAARRRATKNIQCGVPVIDIDGQLFCGFDPDEIGPALGVDVKKLRKELRAAREATNGEG